MHFRFAQTGLARFGSSYVVSTQKPRLSLTGKPVNGAKCCRTLHSWKIKPKHIFEFLIFIFSIVKYFISTAKHLLAE